MSEQRYYTCMMFANFMDKEETLIENIQPVIGWDDDGYPETPAGTFTGDSTRNRGHAVYDRIDDRILVNSWREYVGDSELRDAFVEGLRNNSDWKHRIDYE